MIGLSLGTPNFLRISNIMNMMHGAVSMLVLSFGLTFVIMTRNLDISVGSVAFFSATVGSLFIVHQNGSLPAGVALIFVAGLCCGALNGFIVVVLRVNSFIATLGTMFALRGVALQILRGRVISLPETIRGLGNVTVGPVFVDILISFAVVFLLHLLHTRTRHNIAHIFELVDRIVVLRNGEKVGERVKRETNANEIVSMITGVGA